MFAWRSASERDRHQLAILREFQDATVQRDEAHRVAALAARIVAESDERYLACRRAMRRVAEGGV
jgi:CRISPR/Cas system CMR-associated protein Cmr5 small subunit